MRDERDAQVFLHVNRRGLEPGHEGRALGLLERSGLVGNEPRPSLLGDRGANLLFAWCHDITPFAPFDAGNGRAPAPGTFSPCAATR